MSENRQSRIREFREKLTSYVFKSETAVAITRHGETIGYYIPVRHKRTETERAALKGAASQINTKRRNNFAFGVLQRTTGATLNRLGFWTNTDIIGTANSTQITNLEDIRLYSRK